MHIHTIKQAKIENKYLLEIRNQKTKNGKRSTSHRYNQLPLLRSHPGGFSGAGCVGLATANIHI